ncbi:DUF6086 family protein [Micromonospora echinaurantiaca]|uniref:DUF6086 family protein n=1 Tax=Micromonospora echinaurantiaca TaxID=47857 RepID=UPI0037B10057
MTGLDLDVFVGFVDALVAQYLSSSHAILRSLREGLTATTLVMVDRAGRNLPSIQATAAADLNYDAKPAGRSSVGKPQNIALNGESGVTLHRRGGLSGRSGNGGHVGRNTSAPEHVHHLLRGRVCPRLLRD